MESLTYGNFRVEYRYSRIISFSPDDKMTEMYCCIE